MKTRPSLPARIVTCALLIQLAACGVIPGKHIHTEITIAAPSDVIWDILTNNERYPEWNPYHVRVDGRLEKGETLDLEIHKPNGDRVYISPHVTRLETARILSWGGGIPGIFRGEHVFELQALDEQHTRLLHFEEFSGFAVPFASLEAIEAGYKQMNQSLKTRAETRWHRSRPPRQGPY